MYRAYFSKFLELTKLDYSTIKNINPNKTNNTHRCILETIDYFLIPIKNIKKLCLKIIKSQRSKIRFY